MQAAHSPCGCAQLAVWQQLVQDEIKTADVQAKGGDPNNVEGAELANGKGIYFTSFVFLAQRVRD
jgi:hypothetical protein